MKPSPFNSESISNNITYGDVVFKKTKIICTVGPASFSKEVIKKMFNAIIWISFAEN